MTVLMCPPSPLSTTPKNSDLASLDDLDLIQERITDPPNTDHATTETQIMVRYSILTIVIIVSLFFVNFAIFHTITLKIAESWLGSYEKTTSASLWVHHQLRLSITPWLLHPRQTILDVWQWCISPCSFWSIFITPPIRLFGGPDKIVLGNGIY